MKEYPIWNSETGITDLDENAEQLGVPQVPDIKAAVQAHREKLKDTPELSGFTERLHREYAIENGVVDNIFNIERTATDALKDSGFLPELLPAEATDRPPERVLELLLDNLETLANIREFVEKDRKLTMTYIKELHALLLRNQPTAEGEDDEGNHVDIPLVRGEWKKEDNDAAWDDIVYKYCPAKQVNAEMKRLVTLHKEHVARGVPCEVQAAWLHHRLTQIHPFQTGNGRVARALASIVLLRGGLFPMTVSRDGMQRYFDTLERADEGDLRPFVEFIVNHQARKTRSLFKIELQKEGIEGAIGGLMDAADKAADEVATEQQGAYTRVFELAELVRENLLENLESIMPTLKEALLRVTENATTYVEQSTEETAHYFRSEIVSNAKYHLGYFADTKEYKSWVGLNMRWTRRARLVFAVHGIGKPFRGNLICAPCLIFKELDVEGYVKPTLVPVTDEGFVFVHSEEPEAMLKRFGPWREAVFMTALKEVAGNL